MADGKIYITISDTRGGSGAGVSNDADSRQEKDKEGALSKFVQHKFFNMIQSESKHIMNYAVGNIGNFTGNYQAQRDTEMVLSHVNYLINLGVAAYTGAKLTGSWIGAAVAVGVTVTQSVINIGLESYSNYFQNKKTNNEIKIMRERLGLEGLTDGSRTGGY